MAGRARRSVGKPHTALPEAPPCARPADAAFLAQSSEAREGGPVTRPRDKKAGRCELPAFAFCTSTAALSYLDEPTEGELLGELPGGFVRIGVAVDSALRKTLERRAARAPDGATEAALDGVRARKFGRNWRIRFSEAWGGP